MFIGAVMEHIEEAGVHSGDSSCVIPPPTLSDDELDRIEETVAAIARALDVRGLINVQLALRDDVPYVLEANPRASRTVPFVSKATGIPLAKAAARVMAGARLSDLRAEGMLPPETDQPLYRSLAHVAVKAAVLPFGRFPGVDTVLGPGDALDRRGHGRRAHARARRSRGRRRRRARRCRRAAPCSCRWRTATSAPSSCPPGACPSSGSR